ncbi:hypothetical protein BGZ60DRAFT_408426 [Tricladium varicosporioides]|nr:hypothetical protein BGZ60DRAFT_408426 [Hymenoscyphus varicosporioides]
MCAFWHLVYMTLRLTNVRFFLDMPREYRLPLFTRRVILNVGVHKPPSLIFLLNHNTAVELKRGTTPQTPNPIPQSSLFSLQIQHLPDFHSSHKLYSYLSTYRYAKSILAL